MSYDLAAMQMQQTRCCNAAKKDDGLRCSD